MITYMVINGHEIHGDAHTLAALSDAYRAVPSLIDALRALHACHRAFSGNDNWTMLDDEARAAAEAALAATGMQS